jgi:hypothetical protein
MSSTFDPAAFLDQSISGTLDTKMTPCPEGEFIAVIESVNPRPWNSKDGTKAGVALDVLWANDDAGVKQQLGRDKILVKQGIMLDLDATGQRLDVSKGKNINLGRLREALDMNDASQPFSFNMLPGNAARARVTHRMDQNGEDVYADIKMVTKP